MTGYTSSYADLLDYQNGTYLDLSETSGLITLYNYYSSTTAGPTTPGGVAGYLQNVEVQQGYPGTPIVPSQTQYYAQTAAGALICPVAAQTEYCNTNGTGAETTSYAYTWFTNTAQMQSETITEPVVSTAQNGPGTPDVDTTFFDTYGRPIWDRDPDGYITYTAYDQATGAVVESITDVNTSQGNDFANLPSGWSTPPGGGLNLLTLDSVDALGRTIEEVSPAGNITYIVYEDSVTEHEVRTYPGWNSSTDMPTGPTQVYCEDWADGYTMTLTMSARPATEYGLPTGIESLLDLQSLSRSLVNNAGQVVEEDDYFNLSGVNLISPPYQWGTLNTNFYATLFAYDQDGQQDWVQQPTGTIEQTDYDSLGRASSTWVGTSASNLVEVSAYVYDNGGVGDSNLTQETDYPGGSAAPRVTQYWYDWQDRQVASQTGTEPITFLTYDNLDETTEVQTYDGQGAINANNGNPLAPAASLLRSQEVISYDNQGNVYQDQTYSVNQTTGAVSSTALTAGTWYDADGNVIRSTSPGGPVVKNTYDGAGQLTATYTTDGGGDDRSWLSPNDVSQDVVLEQTLYTYDADGNLILTAASQRFNNAVGTGPLGNSWPGLLARTCYTAYYYDAADRLTATVDVGNNGGTAWTRPATVPLSSNTVLVTSQTYNAAGLVGTVTDPMGIATQTYYDALGRTTETIDDYTNGTPTTNSNFTTAYTYDGDDNLLTVTEVQPQGTPSQTTQYVYGVSTTTGSDIRSNDILAALEYPNPSTGLPSTASEETYTVDALGETLTYTDRDGNVHSYSYDALGRETADAVTTLGAGVDGSVRSIDTAYDDQGNAYLVTSYNAASGGSIVNQVEDLYNGLDQLTAEHQSHNGAVNLSTTPVVQYAYTDMAGGVNNSRLTSMTYPNGRVLDYNYNNGLDNSISRLSSLSDSSGILESYLYLGLDTVVERDHPQTGVNQTFISQNGSTGDGGDQYVGLDRFGRVVSDNWYDTASDSSTEDYQYGYDADADVLWRNDTANSAYGELYTYDSANRLTSFARGTLNSTETGLVGSATYSENWSLDALGNWSSVTTNGNNQTETANAQNEITSISGQATPAYDANGNMTTDQKGNTLVYDAWNRLVAYKSGSTTLESYQYDGLGRMIVQNAGTAVDLYYSAAGQVLEERQGNVPTLQYVWSPVYVNAMVLRDQLNSNGSLQQRLYVEQDANWNVTALVSTSGTVVERYVYNPYGAVTVLSGTWGSQSGSNYGWEYLFQGGRYDSVSGLYKFGARDYSAALGRWVETDPLGLGAGDGNLYRMEGDAPTCNVDPSGLEPPTEENNPFGPPTQAEWDSLQATLKPLFDARKAARLYLPRTSQYLPPAPGPNPYLDGSQGPGYPPIVQGMLLNKKEVPIGFSAAPPSLSIWSYSYWDRNNWMQLPQPVRIWHDPMTQAILQAGPFALEGVSPYMAGPACAESNTALGRLFAKTTETGSSFLPAGAGRTDKFGNVIYSTLGSTEDVALARYHEKLHSLLSPKLSVLREFRADLRMAAYNRSSLVRYLEEALAETYAQLRVSGIKGLPTGIAFPVKNGYVTLRATVIEGAGATIVVGGTTYGVYYAASNSDW